jgi:hypothetical protein
MKTGLKSFVGALVVVPALAAQPAAAQNARALMQAADQAIGANKVNSMQFTGTGRYSYLGQNFTVNDDWNRTDLKTMSGGPGYVLTIDYPSKSYKEEMVRTQGNNPKIGGGAGFPIVGEQRANAMASGNYAWTTNAQGQPQAQSGEAATRQLFLAVSPYGFIKTALADPNASVSDREFVSTGRTLKVVHFTMNGKWQATGEFNNQDMLERVVTWIPNDMMGDMQVEIRYSDWRDVGNGIKAPYHIHNARGRPSPRPRHEPAGCPGERREGQRAERRASGAGRGA